jgi:hypothetical protein
MSTEKKRRFYYRSTFLVWLNHGTARFQVREMHDRVKTNPEENHLIERF